MLYCQLIYWVYYDFYYQWHCMLCQNLFAAFIFVLLHCLWDKKYSSKLLIYNTILDISLPFSSLWSFLNYYTGFTNYHFPVILEAERGQTSPYYKSQIVVNFNCKMDSSNSHNSFEHINALNGYIVIRFIMWIFMIYRDV